MKVSNIRPTVKCYNENEWEFVYPNSIDNEKTYNEFWEGVELLDYDDTKAEKIFKGLIAKHPFYIDAYNHLSISFRNQNKTFESLLTAEKSYNIGKQCFPNEFNPKTDKLIWSILENRPFLRACQTYGLECQAHKDYSTAIEIFNENLLLNDNDNQGIRYLLLEIYFVKKDLQATREIIEKFKDDYSIEFMFGAVSLEIMENNFDKADNILKEAVKINKFFIAEIIKDKHQAPPPFRLPGEPNYNAGIPIGSIQQAYDYWLRNKELYKTKKIQDYYKERKASFE